MKRALAVAALALVGTLPGGLSAMTGGSAPPAAVHTALEAAYPAEDSVHAAPISEIRLRYTTAVQVDLSAITVLGPDGQISSGPVDILPGTEAREIGVRFDEPLPSGRYTVEWRTAGPDSHVIRGSYVFTVDRPVPEPTDAAQASPTPPAGSSDPELSAQTGSEAPDGPGAWGVMLNWLFLLSVVGMVGVVAFRTAVLGRVRAEAGLEPVAAALDRRLTALAWIVAVLALGVLPFRLAREAALVAGPDGSMARAVGTLLGLTWGSSWLLELAAVALFLVGLLLARREEPGRTPWLLAGGAALLMVLVPALVGHSGGAGPLAVTADALHVLAAGVWAGGLGCLVLAGIPAAAGGRAEDGSTPALPLVVASFSRVAVGAVALLVASGVVGVLHHVALGELLSTGYGRLLSLKVLAALAALSLGFYNWRVVRPQLEETPRTRLIRIPATLELTVALGVLALTAALIATATP